MAPSRYDWKIVDWDVKPQHNQNLRASLMWGELSWGEMSVIHHDTVYM